jgi:hypothetical protein
VGCSAAADERKFLYCEEYEELCSDIYRFSLQFIAAVFLFSLLIAAWSHL